MKRLHVHISVESLDDSIGFYSTLFGVDPDVREADYAKWMLDDPRVNFAISERCGRATGVDHLGIQVEADAELEEISDRLSRANHPVVEQKGAKCCYAEGDKAWASDPQGVAWETFHTVGGIAVYGGGRVDRSTLTPDKDNASGCRP
jgi:catechol 2,3-dioxygenase-like lactoylglutathione lyase family enzyme